MHLRVLQLNSPLERNGLNTDCFRFIILEMRLIFELGRYRIMVWVPFPLTSPPFSNKRWTHDSVAASILCCATTKDQPSRIFTFNTTRVDAGANPATLEPAFPISLTKAGIYLVLK